MHEQSALIEPMEPHPGSSGNHTHEEVEDWRVLAALALGCLVFGLAGFAGELLAWPAFLTIPLFLCAYACGGYDAAVDSVETIREGRLDVHFLMLAVAVGAALVGAWHEGALLLFLFSASGAMEAFAMHRTRREIDSLLQGAPKFAHVVDGDHVRVLDVDALEIGMIVRVTDGEAVPADIQITRGESACDESNLSGEAVPVPKQPGDTAFSGTINVGGVIEGDVLRPANQSALQKVIALIRNAQEMKAPSQRFSDRFGGAYTWIVLGLCAGMFLVWWLVFGLPPIFDAGEERSAFYRSMTLLVVMSPCALVLSVPSAILSAIATGARRGVLFRGGAAVEMLAHVDVVAMDKTGTLTTGELRLAAFDIYAGTESSAREIAISLAALSEHPLSRAIQKQAVPWALQPHEIENVHAIPGQGMTAKLRGDDVFLGKKNLIPKDLFDGVSMPSDGNSVHAEVWISGPGVLACLRFSDEIRSTAREMIQALHESGIKTVMLTGDRDEAARAMQDASGILEFRAGLLPSEKLDAIQALKANGAHRVAMIGDGVNDAPCLAAADVGVAMGVRGSDAALEQADIVLMNDKLEGFLLAQKLSRSARKVIHQNITISLGTVILMAVGAFIFPIPLGIGVFAHEGSTVIVVLNALRLLAVRL